MEEYIVGDEVVLTKNREGFIRFKGELPGKEGIFYGIELTEGTEQGKNSGEFKGKSYFSCAEPGTGTFISEKYIVLKLNDKPNKSPKKKKKKKIKAKPKS